MSFSKKIINNSIKGLRYTALVSVCALLGTQFLSSNELHAAMYVPTSYNISDLSLAMNRQVPAGYVKSNYKVNCSQTPTAKDLSSTDAAEIIAQEAYRLTKKSLDNQTINLVYSPLTNTCNSKWTGNITFNANDTMSVIIDGSTGELLHIRHIISIPVASPQKEKTDAETDREGVSSLKSLTAEFNENKDANCAKAQELITKSGYVPETIKTFTYADSYSGLQFANNKVISTSCAHIFNAVTTSGKTYKFYLSRDLTHITEVWTPEFLAQLEATKALRNNSNA